MRVAFWLGVVSVTLGLAGSASAEDPIGRISVGASGGISDYLLADINDRITNQGNTFLEVDHLPPLRGLDRLDFGWAFWADAKFQLPMLPFLFVSAGYGTSSGSTQSPDVDNVLKVEVSQRASHLRVLYVLPFRFQKDTRLFLGGGPLFIHKQEAVASQTNRTNRDEQWSESITYSGSGMGWQVGLCAEYMLQDRVTLCADLAYRFANLEYDSWSSEDDVDIVLPVTAETDEHDRLHYLDSYPGHVFLDWAATEQAGSNDQLLTTFGPHREYLEPLDRDEIGIDMSGVSFHLGFRFYFL
jgi:hypothetical protein